MVRAADATPPAVAPHPLPPDVPMARWPGTLRIALEYLPQGAYAWDDPDPAVVWDNADPDRYVWDAPATASGYTDVVCDFHALEIDPGEPDELGLYPPTMVTLSLRNPDGRYTIWSSDGRLTYWAPGRRLAVWVDIAGTLLWIFNGRMTTWQAATDGTVTIEAFDGLAQLAEDVAEGWTPGAAGQTALARIQAIAAQTGYLDPIRGDGGGLTLSTGPSDLAPLEECQRTALSDGGVFTGDADGALIYRNRLWRAGRDDQVAVAAFSDNVCPAADGFPVTVWDADQAADDVGLFTRIELENVAGTKVVAALPAGSPGSWWTGAQYRRTHPDPDLWTTAGDGQALADYHLAQSSTPALAVRGFGLWLHAPQLATAAMWRVLLDLRRGDRIGWVSDYTDRAGQPGRVDIALIVTGLAHVVAPDSWVVTVAGTRTVEAFPVYQWDRSPWTWDDPDPTNVWRY
jgi:hypothetical protein